MQWDLARKALALSLVFMLVLSGVGPFVNLSPAQPTKATHGGNLYIGINGAVEKWDENADNLQWAYTSFGTDDVTDMVVTDNYVIATTSAKVAKIDASDGSEVWSKSITNFGWSVTVDSEGDIYHRDGTDVIKRDGTDGSANWTYTGHSDNLEDIESDASGHIYTVSNDGTVHKVGQDNGTQVWSFTPSDLPRDVEIGTNQGLYISGQNGYFKRIDPSDKSIIWSNQDLAQVEEVDALPDGTVVAGDTNGKIIGADPSDGSQLWTVTPNSNRVEDIRATSSGNFYVTPQSSQYVYYIDGSDGSQIWGDSGFTSSSPESLGTDYSTTKTFDVSSSVSGSVADSDGNQIEQSDVTITDQSDGSIVFQGTTDASGAWSTELGDGDYRVEANKDGYHSDSTTFTVAGSAVSGIDLTLTQDTVSGVVKTEGRDAPRGLGDNPNGVSNATVEIWAVNDSEVTTDPGQSLRDAEEEMLEKAANPIPDEYRRNENQDLSKLAEQSDTEQVLVHSRGAWTDRVEFMGVETPLKTTGDLSSPDTQLEAGKTYTFSVWDLSKSDGLSEDPVDRAWKGSTVNSNITLEKIGPGSGVVSSTELEPEVKYKSEYAPGVTRKKHYVVETELQEGIYRLRSEDGAIDTWIRVGSLQEIAHTFEKDLKTEAGQLSDRAKLLEDRLNTGTFKRIVVTTDANGRFSADIPAGHSTVAITAYKGGGLLSDTAPEEQSLQLLRERVQQHDYNGSIYLSTAPETVHPPEPGVTVTVREIESPTHSDIDEYLDKLSWLQDLFNTEDYAALAGLWQDPTTELTEEELRNRTTEAQDIISELEDAEERIQELENRDTTEITRIIQEGNSGELEELLANQTQVLSEMQTTVESQREVIQELRNGTETDSGQSLLNLKVPFRGTPSEEGTTVLVHLDNGTSRTMSEEYWTVETRTLDDISGSATHDFVVIEDYPLPNGSSVANIEVHTATDNGYGEREVRVENPSYDGEIPEIDSFDLNTLRPSTGEAVTLEVNPAEESDYRQLANATVYAPSGAVLDANVSSSGLTFRPEETGTHQMKLQLETTGGDVVTETVRVKAVRPGESADMPEGVRVHKGITGKFAVTGDGIQSASIRSEGSSTKLGVVLPEESSPRKGVHVYPQGALSGAKGTIDVRVMRGSEQGTGVEVPVVVHSAKLSEDALLYRNGEPVTDGSGTAAGRVEQTPGSTLIHTYSDTDGELQIRYNNDPSRLEKFWFGVQTVSLSDLNPLALLPAPGQLPAPELPQLEISLHPVLQLGAPDSTLIGVPGAAHIDATPGVRL